MANFLLVPRTYRLDISCPCPPTQESAFQKLKVSLFNSGNTRFRTIFDAIIPLSDLERGQKAIVMTGRPRVAAPIKSYQIEHLGEIQRSEIHVMFSCVHDGLTPQQTLAKVLVITDDDCTTAEETWKSEKEILSKLAHVRLDFINAL